MTVFGDYHAVDVVSQKNARAIEALAHQLPCHGRIDMVRPRPGRGGSIALGLAAYSEYEREFGSRIVARWPQHLVLDGLDTIEILLETGDLMIHPRRMRFEGRVSETTAAIAAAVSGSTSPPMAIRKKT